MRLRVMVEVIDDDGDVVARRLRSTDVERKVVALFEAVAGEDVPAFIADDAISGALGAASKSADSTDLLTAAIGAPELSTPSPQPSQLQPQQAPAAPKAGGLEDKLGLHLIEHMDSIEAAQGAGGPQAGPGPIGFGPNRSR